MAEVTQNDLTEGISGRLGNKIVFRQLGTRTIASKRPKRTAPFTEEQLAHRERFKLAAQYAKAKMLDPAAKAEYTLLAKGKKISAFAAALGDYLKLPEIISIKANAYTGNVGDVILVNASDNFKVTLVKVTIVDANGTLVETADATLTPGDVEWKYTATVQLPSIAGAKIIATAYDRPGNEITLEMML